MATVKRKRDPECDSRVTDESGTSATIVYEVFGVASGYDAEHTSGIPALGQAHPDDAFIFCVSVTSKPMNVVATLDDCRFIVTCQFKSPQLQKSDQDKEEETEESEEVFEVGVEQVHIDRALSTTHYPAEDTRTGTLINVSDIKGDAKVEGVDIYSGVEKFSVVNVRAEIDDTYKAKVRGLVVCVNVDEFRGYQAGEVLFVGLSARRRGKGPWHCTWELLVSKNKTVTVVLSSGEISVEKNGWQYIEFQKKLTASADERQIEWSLCGCKVHDTYESGGFENLEIPYEEESS